MLTGLCVEPDLDSLRKMSESTLSTPSATAAATSDHRTPMLFRHYDGVHVAAPNHRPTLLDSTLLWERTTAGGESCAAFVPRLWLFDFAWKWQRATCASIAVNYAARCDNTER